MQHKILTDQAVNQLQVMVYCVKLNTEAMFWLFNKHFRFSVRTAGIKIFSAGGDSRDCTVFKMQ